MATKSNEVSLPAVKRHEFKTEYLFSYVLNMPSDDKPLVIGEVPSGLSLVLYERGSRITGPRINGRFTPDAEDYVIIQRDGVSIHKVRTIIITEDGARISFIYEGRGEWGPDGFKDFVEGKMPEKVRITSAPYLQSSHPDYLWVNRLQCIDVGEVYASEGWGSFDVYGFI